MEEKNFFKQLKEFLRERFELDSDKADQSEVIENIRKGVEFRGTNLWILIFATVIASVGLNVNSTAVIIGAMLISPLMGPIMGIGMSLGINDFELMKKSFKNFSFSVIASLLASTLYFAITPLSHAQSELLARTTPTTWDVMIATFGGLAGIVAASRRDRTSTVIPGVAIATALMPPLCTAGFGLATGNWQYFAGALYLFFINAVFIAFATFFIVRFMKYERKQQLDQKRAKKVKHYMVIILTATLVPSVIMAYGIVQRTGFEIAAQKYVSQVLTFEGSEIVNPTFVFDRKNGNTIEAIIVGNPLSEEVIEAAKTQLGSYGLLGTKLIIRQSNYKDQIDNKSLESLLASNTETVSQKNKLIDQLSKRLNYYTSDTLPTTDIAREIASLQGGIASLTITKGNEMSTDGKKERKTTICILSMEPGVELTAEQKDKIQGWLAIRTKTPNVQLIINHTQNITIQ